MDELLARFRRLYTENIPEQHQSIEPAAAAELDAFEADTGLRLPDDVRAYFMNADFAITDEGNFESFSFARAVESRQQYLDMGSPIGPERYRDNDGVADGRIHGVFFHRGWLPFAMDGGGNHRAISLDPPPNGTFGQVVALEFQDGQGPFPLAASLREYLESTWASVEARGLHELTPRPKRGSDESYYELINSIWSNDGEAARAALAAGADGARRDGGGETPLFTATMQQATDVAIAIAEACPDACGMGDTALGYYPLTFAEDPRLIKALLDGGADPNVFWDNGANALSRAAERGDLESMRLLVEAGANMNPPRSKWSPATSAAYRGHEDAVLLLLELGCQRDDANLRKYAAEKNLVRVLAELDA